MYLKEDQLWQRIMEVNEHPSITINNHTYFGNFVGKDIGRAVCASFKDRPSYCTTDKMEKIHELRLQIVDSDSNVFRDLMIALVVFGMIFAGYLYLKKHDSTTQSKTDIQIEVNQAVA